MQLVSKETALRNLLLRIDRQANGCWIWTGKRHADGYGDFWFRGERRANRVSWILHKGTIPAGLCVCHNCPGGDNSLCVNPDHLWLGTHAENMKDRDAKGRTASGDRSGSRTHPEKIVRGDDTWFRKHPELAPRGELHVQSKLTDHQRYVEIFVLRKEGWAVPAIAKHIGVTESCIWNVLRHARRGEIRPEYQNEYQQYA